MAEADEPRVSCAAVLLALSLAAAAERASRTRTRQTDGGSRDSTGCGAGAAASWRQPSRRFPITSWTALAGPFGGRVPSWARDWVTRRGKDGFVRSSVARPRAPAAGSLSRRRMAGGLLDVSSGRGGCRSLPLSIAGAWRVGRGRGDRRARAGGGVSDHPPRCRVAAPSRGAPSPGARPHDRPAAAGRSRPDAGPNERGFHRRGGAGGGRGRAIRPVRRAPGSDDSCRPAGRSGRRGEIRR